MPTQPRFTTRFRADQKDAIEQATRLREAAISLRSAVSHGSYGDEQLRQFWHLTEAAGMTLMISNTDLGERAGLGSGFFSSVARDRRRPKLANLLRALTAIIEAADERIPPRDSSKSNRSDTLDQRIRRDCTELFSLATSLSQMAYREIERLDSERPNDPTVAEANIKQRELLLILAEGLGKIAAALAKLSDSDEEARLLTSAKKIVVSVGKQVNDWWAKNAPEAIDWTVRLPVLAGGVALLGWAGANMTIATSAVAAIVGGPKVIAAIRNQQKGRK